MTPLMAQLAAINRRCAMSPRPPWGTRRYTADLRPEGWRVVYRTWQGAACGWRVFRAVHRTKLAATLDLTRRTLADRRWCPYQVDPARLALAKLRSELLWARDYWWLRLPEQQYQEHVAQWGRGPIGQYE